MKYGICNQKYIINTTVTITTTATTTTTTTTTTTATTVDYTRQYLKQDLFLNFLTADPTNFHEHGPMTETCGDFLTVSMFRALVRRTKFIKKTNKCTWIYECNFIAQ
jgi:hypothetical protein